MHDGETSITIRLDHMAAGPSGSTRQVVDMFSSSTGYSLELHDFNVIVRLDDHDEGEIYLRVFSCGIATAKEEVRRERDPFPNLPGLGVKQEIQKRVNMLRELRKASKENASSSQRSSKSDKTRGTAGGRDGGLHTSTMLSPSQGFASQGLHFQTQLPVASQPSISTTKKQAYDDVEVLGGVNLAPPLKPRQHVSTTADTVPSAQANLFALLARQPTKSFARTAPMTAHNLPQVDPRAAKVPDVPLQSRSLHATDLESIQVTVPAGPASAREEAYPLSQPQGIVNDTRSFATQLSQATEMFSASQSSAAITNSGPVQDKTDYRAQERLTNSVPIQQDRSVDMSEPTKPKGIAGRHTRSFGFVEAFRSITNEVEGVIPDVEGMDLDESSDPFVVGDVPDKQQLILYRPESVYSPNMSRPFPQGNIPIAIFRPFIAEAAEARSEAKTELREVATATTVQNNTDEDDDDDEEDLLSWDPSSPVRSPDAESPSPGSSPDIRAPGVSSHSQMSWERLSPRAKTTASRLDGKDPLPLDSSAPAPDVLSSSSSSSLRSPASQHRHTDDLTGVFPSLQNTLSSSMAGSGISRSTEQARAVPNQDRSPRPRGPATRRDSQSSGIDIEMEMPQALPNPTPMSTTSVRSRVSDDASGHMRGLQTTGSASAKRAPQAVSALQTPVVSKFKSSGHALSASQPSPRSTASPSITATGNSAASQQPRQHSLSIRSATSDRSAERQRASWNSHFPITPVPTLESLQTSPVQLVPGTFNSSDRRAFNQAPLVFSMDGNVDPVPTVAKRKSSLASVSGPTDKRQDPVRKASKKRPALEEPTRQPGSELVQKRHKFDFNRPSQVEDPVEANRRMRNEFARAKAAELKTVVQPARTEFTNDESRKRPYKETSSAENTPPRMDSFSSHAATTLNNSSRQTRTVEATKDSEMDRHHESMDDVQHERTAKRPRLHDTPQSVRHDSVSVHMTRRDEPSILSTHVPSPQASRRELQPQHAVKEVTPPRRTSTGGGVNIVKANADQPAPLALEKSSSHALAANDEPQRGASRVFTVFTAAYPVYCGDIKHFQGLCRMIKRLNISHGLLHRSLWDDFIIRHRRDYTLYMVQCLQNGDPVKAYEVYYQEDIEEPSYTLRILTPQTLEEVLTEVHPGEARPPQQQIPQQQAVTSPAGSIPAGRPQGTPVGVPQTPVIDQSPPPKTTRPRRESQPIQVSTNPIGVTAAKSHSPKLVARSTPILEQVIHTGSVKPSNALQPQVKTGKSLSAEPEAIDLTMGSPPDIRVQPAAEARPGSVSSRASSVFRTKDVAKSSKATKHGVPPPIETSPDQGKQPKRKVNYLDASHALPTSSAAAQSSSTTTQPSGTGRKGSITARSTQPIANSTRMPTNKNTTVQSAGNEQSARRDVASRAQRTESLAEPQSKTKATRTAQVPQRADAPVPARPAHAVAHTKTTTVPAQKSKPAKPVASGVAAPPAQLRNSNMVLPKPASAPVAVGSMINKPYSVNHCMICGTAGHWMSNCPVSHGKMLAKEEARQAFVNATTKRAVRRDPNYDTSEADQDVTIPPFETEDPAVRPPRVPSTSAQGTLSTPNNIPTGPRNPGHSSQRSAQWRNNQQQSQARFPLR